MVNLKNAATSVLNGLLVSCFFALAPVAPVNAQIYPGETYTWRDFCDRSTGVGGTPRSDYQPCLNHIFVVKDPQGRALFAGRPTSLEYVAENDFDSTLITLVVTDYHDYRVGPSVCGRVRTVRFDEIVETRIGAVPNMMYSTLRSC